MRPAPPADWDGAVEVFERVGKALPRLAKVWADSAYRVDALATWGLKRFPGTRRNLWPGAAPADDESPADPSGVSR